MKKRFILLSLALVAGFMAKGQTGKVEYKEYDLPNGLHVVLHQDHNTPNVIVSLMYHVGTKNEDPSKTGFAHFFEHLMFEGAENIARGEYFKLIQSSGGELNANTSQDRTYYYELLPSNQLELALWMESDRMLHAKIDTVGVNTQKGVVIEERKQSYETKPYGTWMEEVGKRLFTVHPYRWSTIGSPDHIRNANFDDIFNFYKTYYVPNNAVLVVAGDFEEGQAKAWIEKYFAPIPKGTKPFNRPTIVEPPQTAEVRDVVYDKVQLPGIFMGYHAPAMGTKDAYTLEILSSILSGGASSRFKTNVTDKGIALETIAFPYIQEQPGVTYVISIAGADKKIEDVENAINAEIEKVRTDLVSEEEFQMAMAAKEFEVASKMTKLENVAEDLANSHTYFKDTDRVNRELSFYSNISREDIREVAKKYLAKNNRVILYYLPESQKK